MSAKGAFDMASKTALRKRTYLITASFADKKETKEKISVAPRKIGETKIQKKFAQHGVKKIEEAC